MNEREESAQTLYARLRELDANAKVGFIERGVILIQIEDGELWKLISDPLTQEPFTSLNTFIHRACPWSHRDAYYAKDAARELGKDLSMDDLTEIPRCNLEVLKSLSTSVRKDPKVISAAKEFKERDFVAMVQDRFPEQHIEVKTPSPKLSTSLAKLQEQAIALAITVEDGVQTREDALEAIYIGYMTENALVEL